jgi:hypothetical protein
MFITRRSAAKETWEGVVLEKSRGMTDGANLYRYLTVRMSTGRSRKVRVDRDLWDSVAQGDGIVKEAGAKPAKK